MKVLCFALFACAFNLLLGFAGLLSFGHAAFFGGAGLCLRLAEQGTAASRPNSASWPAAPWRRCSAALFGALSIRRSGIYLTMITLALAQLVFFFAVQLPFTGGEDGLQGVPRGKLFGLIDLTDNLAMYFFVFAVFVRRLLADPPHHPFAVRPGAEGDPRERAARHLAGLRRGALQAAGLRAVGLPGRCGRRA